MLFIFEAGSSSCTTGSSRHRQRQTSQRRRGQRQTNTLIFVFYYPGCSFQTAYALVTWGSTCQRPSFGAVSRTLPGDKPYECLGEMFQLPTLLQLQGVLSFRLTSVMDLNGKPYVPHPVPYKQPSSWCHSCCYSARCCLTSSSPWRYQLEADMSVPGTGRFLLL